MWKRKSFKVLMLCTGETKIEYLQTCTRVWQRTLQRMSFVGSQSNLKFLNLRPLKKSGYVSTPPPRSNSKSLDSGQWTKNWTVDSGQKFGQWTVDRFSLIVLFMTSNFYQNNIPPHYYSSIMLKHRWRK